MQLTGELAPLGYAHRETEFIIAPSGPAKGQRIYNTCGPTAYASAASAALQRLVTTEAAFSALQAHGLCDATGLSTDGSLAKGAGLFGLSIAEHRPYGEPWAAWPTFLGWHLGSRAHPVLLQVANGQALHDAISGLGENATGLRYHFIALIKRHTGGPSAYAGGKSLPNGYWACDGDNYAGGNDRAHNFAAADVLQFYSDATLAAALPCAGIAFNRAPVTPPAPPEDEQAEAARVAQALADATQAVAAAQQVAAHLASVQATLKALS